MPVTEGLTIDIVLDFCREHNIKAIIPSRDGELQFWAKMKGCLLTQGITVMVSPEEGVEICNDKLLFSQKLQEHQLPVIPSFLSVDEVGSEAVVLKEQFGAGSKKLALNISKKEAEIKATEFASPLFQPFIKGKEFSADVYVGRKGCAKGAIVRSRDLIVDGESQITTTVSNSELELLCRKVAEMLQLYGHVVFQVIEDEKHEFHLIECNARFGGASTLSIDCGLDSFYWFLLEASGVDVAEYPFLRSNEEKRQVRFPEDMVILEKK
jgi:carbamoyl-phosphate synthase large subunit